MYLTHFVLAKHRVLLRTAMAFTIAANAANGQSSSAVSLSLSIDDPRPVAAAAQELMNRHDLIITYEDPVYVHGNDVVDAIGQVCTNQDFSSARALVPIGGRMDFDYSAAVEAEDTTAMPEVVRALLEYHELGGGAGRFRVSESGSYVHVIPEQVRDSAGAWAPYQPVLNARVTIENGDKNALEIIQDLLVAISTATDRTVVIGSAPINPLLQSRPAVDADNRVARDVLADVLSSVGDAPLTWMLFYDPGQRTFVLNVLPARMPNLPTNVPTQDTLPGDVDPATGRVRNSTD